MTYNENNHYFIDYLMDNLPHRVFWKDRNLVFQGCNKQFAKQFGFDDPEQIVGLTDYDFPWSPELRDKYINDDKEILLNGKAKLDYEEKQQQEDGLIRTVLVSKTPVFNDNREILGVLGIYTDITERKRKEQLEIEKQIDAEKLKLTEAFSATLAHDLRTPVTALGLCIDSIKTILNAEKMGPQEKKTALAKFFAQGHDTAEKAKAFITMMLRKIRSIGQKVKKEDLDLCMISEDVKDALAEYPLNDVERTQVTWNKENAFVYLGNSLDTQHIVFNLLGNALKFIDQEGKGHVTISFEQDTNYNKFIVNDTAKGIEPQYMSTIFDAFVTKDESGKGTGLGLAFCKSTMQNYGGDITCESKFGEYTKFICTFPKVSLDEV